MKKAIGFLLIGVVLIAQAALLYAASASFNLTATITGITGSSISAQTVTPPTTPGGLTVWAPLTGFGMSFDPMTLKTFTVSGTQYQAFLPDHFFAIDVAGTGGAGTPSTVVNYVPGSRPTGASTTQTLGDRANIDYRALKYNAGANPTEFVISSHGQKLLKNVVNENITAAQVTGAGAGATWLRMYVGINNGLDATNYPPFTPGDPAGSYTGRLDITSTP